MAGWVGTGIAPPATHQLPTPGTPSRYVHGYQHACTGQYGGANSVVGLKSVAQLTSGGYSSGFQGITEVYNLIPVGRINNHLYITGNK